MTKQTVSDYVVLVNGLRSGSTYDDLDLAIEVAERLHQSNDPHLITIFDISTDATVWRGPPRA
jgi:hypothetical protein